FEPLQSRRRLEPEILVERLPRSPVRFERVRLPARAIERQHQLRAERLAQRMLGDEVLQLADELAVAAERELRLVSLLECRKPDLLEALDRGAGERLVGEVGERRAAPEAERLPQELGRA